MENGRKTPSEPPHISQAYSQNINSQTNKYSKRNTYPPKSSHQDISNVALGEEIAPEQHLTEDAQISGMVDTNLGNK